MLVMYVQYHSTEWKLLVEMGYITAIVDTNNIAHMHKGRQ